MNAEFLKKIKLWPTASDWLITGFLVIVSLGVAFTPIRTYGMYLLGLTVAILPVTFGVRGFLTGFALCSSSLFHTGTQFGLLEPPAIHPTLVHLPGFYLTLPECLTIGALIAALSRHRELLAAVKANGRTHLLVIMLTMAVPFILIGALQGRAQGYVIWANGLRGLLPILMMLYPLACLNRMHVGLLSRRLTALLLINSFAWITLGSWGHGFFLIGFIAATVTAFAVTNRHFWPWLMLIPLMLWSSWNQMSFTLRLTLLVPVLMGVILFARWKWIRKLTIVGLYLFTCVLIITVVDITHDVVIEPDVWQHMSNLGINPGINPETLHDKFRVDKAIRFKIFDRMGVWMPALTVLKSDPFKLATGRPLLVIREGDELLWNAGAHNVFLEWMLNLGVIPGLWMCAFTVGCVTFVIRFGRKFRNDPAAVWTSLAGLSIIPGLLMGQYPIQSVCGAGFWLMIGFCMKIDAEQILFHRRHLKYAI